MADDIYQSSKLRLQDAINDLTNVSEPADRAALDAIKSMKVYLTADSTDKVSTGNSVDGNLGFLKRETDKAKQVREFFHTQLQEIRNGCRGMDTSQRMKPTTGGKKHSRRHKKKRGKKMRATRTKY